MSRYLDVLAEALALDALTGRGIWLREALLAGNSRRMGGQVAPR